jgi:hypothetical protein
VAGPAFVPLTPPAILTTASSPSQPTTAKLPVSVHTGTVAAFRSPNDGLPTTANAAAIAGDATDDIEDILLGMLGVRRRAGDLGTFFRVWDRQATADRLPKKE